MPTSTSFALSPRNLGFSNPLAYAEFLDDDEVPNKPDVDVGEAFSDSDSSDYLSDEEVKTPKFKLMNNWEE